MSLVVSDAVVLHAFDYLESSRIYRLITRDAGVRSALARGARRSSRRFGSALDLFAQGTAQLHVKSGRDLDTLAAFDVVRARPELGADLGRFTGASVIAELTLRFARDDADPDLFAAVVNALDALSAAGSGDAHEAAVAGAWQVIAALGLAPNVDSCSECGTPVPPEETVLFSHPAGGVLCTSCARLAAAGRRLPQSARDALRRWMSGGHVKPLSHPEARSHLRLLREFVREHLADERPLRAFQAWERTVWNGDAVEAAP